MGRQVGTRRGARQVGTRQRGVGTHRLGKGVYKSTMSKIPEVRKGIEHSIRRTLEGMQKSDDKGLKYLESFWARFKKDQPYLAKLVVREMNSFKNNKSAAAFAHGVWITIAALQSQEEADEMNENWGD